MSASPAVHCAHDEMVPIAKMRPHPRNPNTHPPRQIELLAKIIREQGWRAPITVSERSGHIVRGHGRLLAARLLGCSSVPVDHQSYETDAAELADLVADNRIAELAVIDDDLLADLIGDLGQTEIDMELTGFDAEEMSSFLADIEDSGTRGNLTEEDDEAPITRAEELREKWHTKSGQLWELGEHRLLCGDSTKAEDVARVSGGGGFDMFLTDPPYCSGGFQEAGRASGSIGTSRKGEDGKRYTPRIANDTLSSRGYCKLMKTVIDLWAPSFAYMFTDWRMWVQLFDVMESSGFGVRSMIVWDKGTPSMGQGWRSQHELIMFSAKAKAVFDGHLAVGNVLHSKRTGNPDHPTQKPVDILSTILRVTDFCATVADPFAGSGTTILACEQLGRKCRAVEIDPGYVAVALERWSTMTGREPRLI